MALTDATETTAEPLHPLIGRVLDGRYQILSFAGTGGMASVYRARDLVLGRTVAVKVLHAKFGGNAEFVGRFQREAEFAAGLSGHPNIVSIFDVGADGDLRYIIMEVIEGRDLGEVIEAEGPLPVDRALCIAEEIAVALAFAHRHGLIHRDIKPQNILILPDGRVKVTDFGIAWNGESTPMTRAGVVLGTTHYLSPEQAMGKSPGPQSDIYALGVVLYQMLTGRVPFDGNDRFEVAMRHVQDPVPSPERLNPAIPREVGDIVRKTLSKDPGRRYASADEMAAVLRTARRDSEGSDASRGTPTPARAARAIRPVLHNATAVMTAPLLFGTRRSGTSSGLMPRLLGGACLLAVLASVGLTLAERTTMHRAATRPPQVKGVAVHATPTPPVPGCTGHDPAAVTLQGVTVSPQTVTAGSAVTITYTVQNHSNMCIPLYLRATATDESVANQMLGDVHEGKVVRLQPGQHQVRRQFRFPAAMPGPGSQIFSIDGGVSIFHGPRVDDRTDQYAVTVTP